jgi:lactate dehydrogenase-like 2-hydroxyacid dehydrogenase
MPQDVLLIGALPPSCEARLAAFCTLHRIAAGTDPAELGPARAMIRGLVTGGVIGASCALMEALPRLEIVAVNGIGTDAVDLAHARARGIPVTVTPDVLTDDVADLAIGLLIATARRICVADRFVREGLWGRQALPLATKVSGKRLGILGLGRIGRAIARRAEGFGMDIAYTDLMPLPEAPWHYEPSLPALAHWADMLVVAAAGGPASRNLVNAEIIQALGPAGLLINVARGAIVDEAALVAALQQGRLGAAGLDVFTDEPRVPQALWTMDNVVLQPHRASATVETRIAMGDLVVANLEAHFAGRPLPTPVG